MALSYVNLTLDLFDGQGNYLNGGTATFTPSVQLTDAVDGEIITLAPVTVTFRPTGSPVISLLATDSANVTPSGWAWTVTFSGVAGSPAGFSFFLPYSGGASQKLSALSPVSTAVTQYPAWPGTTLGDMVYGGASPAGTPTRLPGNTAAKRKFLRQLGTGAASAAPAWDTMAIGDIPGADYRVAYNGSLAAFPVDSYGADPTGTADSTAAVNAALTAAEAVRAAGSPFAFVDFGCGVYKLTASAIAAASAGIGFRGQGSGATVIIGSGTGAIFTRTDPDGANSTLSRAAPVQGMTVDGTSCGAGSWVLKDTEVAHPWYQDIVFRNFPAASSGGLWQALTATWAEKCIGIGLLFSNCATGHLQDGGTSPLPSFDYSNWLGVAYDLHDNQTGRTVQANAQVIGGTYEATVNSHTSATNTASYVWQVGPNAGDASSVSGGRILLTGEVDGSGGAPYDFNVGSSASISGEGTVRLSGFTANSSMQYANCKIFGQVLSASVNRPLLQVPGTSFGAWISSHYGTYGVQIAGPGTGSGATIYSGSGAPAISAALGDRYYRTDTPATAGQREYICTTAGSATAGAWTALTV